MCLLLRTIIDLYIYSVALFYNVELIQQLCCKVKQAIDWLIDSQAFCSETHETNSILAATVTTGYVCNNRNAVPD